MVIRKANSIKTKRNDLGIERKNMKSGLTKEMDTNGEKLFSFVFVKYLKS